MVAAADLKLPTGMRWAVNVAKHSPHPIHRMGAVIVRGGNLISAGYNKNHSHPRSNSYDNMIHAELSALIAAGWGGSTLDGDLYVARVTKGGAIGTSKPCSDCMDLILEACISSVTYLDENGHIKKENL